MGNLSFQRLILNAILMVKLCSSFPSEIENKLHQPNKGWLRICTNNKNAFVDSSHSEYYEVEADKCPHGAWLSDSLHGGCVCLNGLWAISQSWCDEDYYVAYGKGHCFKLNNQIQKLTFLGNPQNPFEAANFVTKENGHVFRQFSDQFQMPYEYSHETNRTILQLKPEQKSKVVLEIKSDMSDDYFQFVNDAFVSEEAICLDSPHEWSEKDEALMIYKLKNKIKHISITKGVCQKPLHFEDDDSPPAEPTIFKVLPGHAIHMKTGNIVKSSKNCPLHCNAPESSISTGVSHIRHKRQVAIVEPDGGDFEVANIDRTFTEEDKDTMVNIANLAIVKQELNWLLNNLRPPTLNTQNWKIMRKIKEVFAKVCPSNETPKFLLDSMMRLFRLFYLHSKPYYPNGHVMEEFKQNARIIESLDRCLGSAENFTFEYKWIKKPSQKKCREASETVEDPVTNKTTTKTTFKCECVEDLEKIGMMYMTNATGPSVSFNLTKKEVTLSDEFKFKMPNQEKFNSTYHDFPTETVWKMINFAHYYCAKDFQFNPADHSAMITKLETFFNSEILYRWTKPGLNSDQIWQFLYSAFDLKKFIRGIDACVSAAKNVSQYPEWLHRPTSESRRRKKRSIRNEKLWKGTAYCLDDPWDPVYKLGVDVPNKCADLNIN